MESTSASGEQKRHNVTVITVGSKYEVYVRCPAPSHMQTFWTLAIKWKVKYVVKKSSCVFLPASFLPCVFLRASVSIIELLWYGKWAYNIIAIWCRDQDLGPEYVLFRVLKFLQGIMEGPLCWEDEKCIRMVPWCTHVKMANHANIRKEI